MLFGITLECGMDKNPVSGMSMSKFCLVIYHQSL
jgi:hypothetical protein